MANQFNVLIGNAIRTAKTNSIGVMSELEKDASIVRRILSELQQENPEATDEEIQDEMQLMLRRILEEASSIKAFKSDLLRRNAIKYLLTHWNEVEENYRKIILEEIKKGKRYKPEEIIEFNANPKRAVRQLVMSVIATVRESVENLGEDEIKAIRYEAKYGRGKQYIKKILTIEDNSKQVREEIDMAIGLVLAGSELDAVKYYLRNVINIEKTDKELKEYYVQAIRNILKSLNKFGLLDTNIDKQNQLNIRLGLDNIPAIKENALETVFSEQNLRMLSIAKLSALFAFWDNRLVKEIIRIYRTNYIMHELELDTREAVSNNLTIEQNVTRQELDALNIKTNFLGIKFSEYYKKYRKISDGKDATFDISGDVREMEEQLGKDYKKYFSTIGGLSRFQNWLEEDFGLYCGLENARMNLYERKSSGLLGLLALLYYDNVSENWGLMEEDSKSNKILIAADIEGLNMPLRLHIDKKLVKQFIKDNQGNELLPIYAGAKDFSLSGRHISTKALVPLTQEQQEAIKQIEKETRETDYRCGFVRHLSYLADLRMYPEHLYKKRITIKKGKTKVKKEIVREYIDLETGKLFRLEQGEMVEQTDDERQK